MTDNKSAFAVNQYDENVRKVIPYYDEIYKQIFSVITTYCGDKQKTFWIQAAEPEILD